MSPSLAGLRGGAPLCGSGSPGGFAGSFGTGREVTEGGTEFHVVGGPSSPRRVSQVVASCIDGSASGAWL